MCAQKIDFLFFIGQSEDCDHTAKYGEIERVIFEKDPAKLKQQQRPNTRSRARSAAASSVAARRQAPKRKSPKGRRKGRGKQAKEK